MSSQTKVTLHGALGDHVGRNWELSIRQAREVVAAIEANTGKLYAYLREHTAIEYRVIINGQDHGAVVDFYLVGEFETIDIVPVPAGSTGLWQTIIGVVLIVVGVILFFTPLAAAAPYVLMAGIGLTLGGIAALLTPTPQLGGAAGRGFLNENSLSQKKEEAKHLASYLFGGAANTTQQGNPVPIVYGESIVGSQMISLVITGASLDVELIGAQKPLPASSGFFDLAVWDRLYADPRRALVSTGRKITGYSGRRLLEVAPLFDIGDTVPSTGRAITQKGRRALLIYLCQLFGKRAFRLNFAEASALYRAIGLEVIDIPERSTLPEMLYVLATHYSPDP